MITKKLFLGLALSLVILSCSKDDNESPEMSQAKTTAKIDTKIDNIINDISDITDSQIAIEGGMSGKSGDTPENFLPDCATVENSHTETSWRSAITFDNCQMPNGNILDGKIVIEAVKNTENHSLTIVYAFINFHHNGILVQGTKTVVFTIQSTDTLQTQHPVANITLNMTLTFPDGKAYHREGHRVRQMIEGFTTPYIWHDDVFSITGSWTTSVDEETRTSTITTPLIIKMTCPHIVSGVISTVKNDNLITLDFGNGNCDNTAILTVNGESSTIVLGKD